MVGKRAVAPQKPSLSKPSKVVRAQHRLDAAVARLEAALEAAGGGDGAGDRARADGEAFQQLRAENARLRSVNEAATERLDSAIGRIKAAIGE